MINPIWLENSVIFPTLTHAGLYSLSAAKLVLYTAGHESLMGKFDKQIGGPALSIYQIEPFTFNDLVSRHQKYLTRIGYHFASPKPEELLTNLNLATLVCRLKYLDAPEALPDHNDLPALAAYWKKYYNTTKGAGTVEKFINDNKKYVISITEN